MGDEKLYDACLVQLTKDTGHEPYLREVIRRWREAPKPPKTSRRQPSAAAAWSRRDREEVEKLLRTQISLSSHIERLLPHPKGGPQ